MSLTRSEVFVMKRLYGMILLIICPSLIFSQASRIDFRFDFIRHQAEAMNQRDVPVPATIRFEKHPDESLLESLEQI